VRLDPAGRAHAKRAGLDWKLGDIVDDATVAEIRKSFDQRATIDDINTVKGSDLEITKDSGGIVIVAAYRKEIPLVSNIGVYIDFRAASKE